MTTNPNPVCLLSTGTWVPDNYILNEDFFQVHQAAADYTLNSLNEDIPEEKQRIDDINKLLSWIKKLHNNTGIRKRHYTLAPVEKMLAWYKEVEFRPTISRRAAFWREHVPPMIMNAVDKCLSNWGGDKDRIHSVVAHSTTGWDVPGLAHHIVFNLELPTTTRAIPVNFVGCQGGMTIVYVAYAVALNASDTVPEQDLVLCAAAESNCQLGRFYHDNCSLERSLYMPSVLFGEGAACGLVGRPKPEDIAKAQWPIWEFTGFGTHYIPNTRHVLIIGVSEDPGVYIDNSIKKELPVQLNSVMAKNFPRWLKTACGCNFDEAGFALHPGGLKLLTNMLKLIKEFGCPDAEEAGKWSTKNLVEYGNLASAAILFILNDAVQKVKKDYIYAMAMGPGVHVEYGGLKRFDPKSVRKVKRRGGEGSNFTTVVLVLLLALVLGVFFSGYTGQDVIKMVQDML